ncbi:MAG: PorP/SprF family type IX secretion system membrane protein [Bacteroidota bacterium]
MTIKFLTHFLFLLSCTVGLAQNNVLISQYFKVMPAFAPGLSGANDFLDVRAGARYQWLGYEGAPRTYLFSVNGTLNPGESNANRYNSLRVDNMRPYNQRKTKIGVGGYVFDDQSGALRQLEALVSGAIHIPMNGKTYLSLGISTGIYHTQLEFNDIFVLNPANDFTYQEYIANGARSNQLKITTGMAVYSDRFYLSYSILSIGGSTGLENLAESPISTALSHVALGGATANVGPYFELIPNFYLRYTNGLPVLLDAGLRLRYNQNPYIGLSYRNTNSIIAMFGFTVNDKLNVGYSFETFNENSTESSISSHEILLGLRLFNYGKHTPMW